MTNQNEKRYIYLDNNSGNADWSKRSYDLLGVETLEQLSRFLRIRQDTLAFRRWLREANQYSWVDDAPSEIRIAIRAHRDWRGDE